MVRIFGFMLLVSFVLFLPEEVDAQIFNGRKVTSWGKELPTYKRVKLGYGIPYGFLGVNAELGWQYVSVNVGVGYASARGTDPDLGFAMGARLYILEPEKKLRIRFGGHYGINGIYKENGIQHQAMGFSIAAGFEHRITEKLVYDMDIVVPLSTTNSYRPENRETENKMVPSMGIGFVF